ncbi:MAG: isochorismatase family protein [Robiginitomaculum sp.]|nr:isochorismatase family protein [Robiginitomaculum sp.]
MNDLARTSQVIGQRPALIVVDMINGFTDPSCPLGGDYPDVIAANIDLLAAFRAAHLPIFFTTVIYRSPDQARVFRDRLPALDVLTPDSDWVKINPALGRRPSEHIIEKYWASGFFKTNLKTQLIKSRADSLVITGLTTSGCVRATALDGLQHDFKVFVPREACGDRNPDAHQANLFDLHAKYADVVSVDCIITTVNINI